MGTRRRRVPTCRDERLRRGLTFDLSAANLTLGTFTNAGTFLIDGNTNTTIAADATVTNNGTMTIGVPDVVSSVVLRGNATLAGSGTLILRNAARVYSNSGSGTLTNASTIQGESSNSGTLGNSAIGLANQGLNHANVSGKFLLVNPNTAGLTNNGGTLRFSNGGGSFDNTGGTIEARNGGSVTFDNNTVLTNNRNGTLTGGIYRAVGTGSVLNLPGPAPTALAGGAQIIIANGGRVFFGGTPVDPALISPLPFFVGRNPLAQGVFYLQLPNGNVFGYYANLSDPNFIYHYDLGFEYVFDAGDGSGNVYLYDFKSNGFFYTSPTFSFPYLYDFNLQAFLYYYPDPTNPQRYNTNGVRYFYNFKTGQVISK